MRFVRAATTVERFMLRLGRLGDNPSCILIGHHCALTANDSYILCFLLHSVAQEEFTRGNVPENDERTKNELP